MSNVIEMATKLALSGDFGKAFEMLKWYAKQETTARWDKAVAFQGMGGLVQCDPSLGDGDECGLSYYKRALAHDPENLWALHGVVTTLGRNVPDHQDLEAVRSALDKLLPRLNELPESAQEWIEKKKALFLEMTADIKHSMDP
jgi:hypothetical protein